MTRCQGVIFPDTPGFNSVWMALSQRYSFITWQTQLASYCMRADASVVWHTFWTGECDLSMERKLSECLCFTFAGSSQVWWGLLAHPSLLLIKMPSVLLRPVCWKVEILTLRRHNIWEHFFVHPLSMLLPWLPPFHLKGKEKGKGGIFKLKMSTFFIFCSNTFFFFSIFVL